MMCVFNGISFFVDDLMIFCLFEGLNFGVKELMVKG